MLGVTVNIRKHKHLIEENECWVEVKLFWDENGDGIEEDDLLKHPLFTVIKFLLVLDIKKQ